MNFKKIVKFLTKLLWIFVIGSIFGFVLESMVVLFDKGYIESRQGLLYGPFTQVYGIGAIVYYMVLPKFKKNTAIFVLGMILGGVVEYVCSFVQEKVFGTVSWDYVGKFLSIHGRTAFIYWIYWGIIGIVFMKFIYPKFNNLDKYTGRKGFQFATVFLAIFMVVNITISSMAGYRQKERFQNISAKNTIDDFLDTYYPDYVINRVYANKILKYEISK